ncbi:hypothetical protein LCGC14_1479810, partial [marine sediment metagenome]
MSLVTDTIEAVVGTLTTTTTFMRISKQEEANLILNTTDLSTDPIALYYNLPTVQGEPVAGRSVETHPVEIAFVDKAATADTTGVEDEVTRDAMRTSALEFYHSLVKNYTGIFEEFEGYEMEAVAMDKRFDVLMVGYSLKFDIKQLAGFGTVSVVGTLVNSESTTINTLSPGQTKTQPDITVTQADDTTAAHPSDKDLDVDNFQGAGQTLTQKWDGSTDGEKNTFADARNFEIVTFQYDSANATTALGRMTGLVTAEEAAMSKFVTSLGANWALIDDFIHYGMQTAGNSLTGWKLKTHIAVNAPTHTPGTGFTFNGTTQYINSQFVDSVDGVNFSLNDSIFGIYNVTNNDTAG